MSLVAYGDSDDGSSESESEETSIGDAKTSSNLATSEVIENVQNESHSEMSINVKTSFQTEKLSTLSSFLPKPQNTSEKTVVIHSEPQKKLFNLKTMQDDDEDEIIDFEEEYIPLKDIKKNIQKNTEKTTLEKTEGQKSVGSLFSRMPSPWSLGTGISLPKKREGSDDIETRSAKKGKQPVRIAAPALIGADSDEESDDAKVQSKTVKQSKCGSGLSSLLPKPKHSVTLTISNPNKPSAKLSNRPLIPHTLTKKPTASKEAKAKKKTESGDNSDNEEDKEPVSFFSFSDKKDIKVKASKDITKSTLSEDSEISQFSNNIKVQSMPEVFDLQANSSGFGEESHTVSNDESSYDYSNTGNLTQSYSSSGATTTYYQPQDASESYAYGDYEQSSYTTYYNTQPSESQYQETIEPQAQDIDMEKVQRLQGRKNRNEQVKIIDINAADQTGDTKVQLTNLTAEQFAHKSSKKKGNMPSSQQRRKHQITYLAFQAKEREFELQQQWASNRQTKRQTQAKYGF